MLLLMEITRQLQSFFSFAEQSKSKVDVRSAAYILKENQ